MVNRSNSAALACASIWAAWSAAFALLALLCIAAVAAGPAQGLSVPGHGSLVREAALVLGPALCSALALGFFNASMLFGWAAAQSATRGDPVFDRTVSSAAIGGGVLMSAIVAAGCLVQPIGKLPLVSGVLLLCLAATVLIASMVSDRREALPDPVGDPAGLKARTARAVELAQLSERLSRAGQGEP